MQEFSSKVKWMMVTLLTVTVLIGLSWELLVSSGIEKIFQQSILSMTNKNLVISHLYRKNERWILDHPYLESSANDENVEFQANKATLNYTIDLWNGEIDVFIHLDEPEFNFDEPDRNFNAWLKEIKPSPSIFKINKHIIVHNGLLRLGDKHYSFQGEVCFGSSFEGHFSIDFREGEQGDNQFYVSFLQDEVSNFHLDFQSHQVDCFHLHHLGTYFYPLFKEFRVTEGVLEGNGGLIWRVQYKPLIYGEINLSQLNVEHLSSGLKSFFKEVRFHLSKNLEKSLSSGSIIFCGGESFSYYRENCCLAEIKHLMGGFHLDEEGQAKIVLHGIYDDFLGDLQDLSIQGEAFLPPQALATLNVKWELEGNHHSKGEWQLNEHEHGVFETQLHFLNGSLKNRALNAFLHHFIPSLADMDVQEGSMEGNLSLITTLKNFHALKVHHLKIKDFKAFYKPWKVFVQTPNLWGKGVLDLTSNSWEEGTEIELRVMDGSLHCQDTKNEGIQGIQSYLNISQGKFLNSFIESSSGEMRAYLEMGSEGNQGINFKLTGPLDTLIQIIPNDQIRKQLTRSFAQHHVVLAADIKDTEKGKEVIGLAKILDTYGEEKPIKFGFEICQSGSLSQSKDRYWNSFLGNLPPLANSLFFVAPPKVLCNGYVISQGWFHAVDLPIEDYCAPLIINEDKIKLTGFADIQGSFDNQNLMIDYEAKNVVLENGYLRIEVPEIKQSNLSSLGGDGKPRHYYDFFTGISCGSTPIVNATYLEKNTGLVFSDVNAELIFDMYNIHVPSIESFSQGVYLVGSLDVIFDNILYGYFDVNFYLQSLYGKLTQVQNLFSHFGKALFFLKVPMEGDVSMHQDAGFMKFNFTPFNYSLQAHLKGDLSDGTIMTHYSNVSLHELSLNFEYDHTDNILDFSEIQGTLLVGEAERAEEYHVVGERIHFSDYAQNRASFDLWVGDKKRDVIRLVGETFSSDVCPGEDCVQFVLNPRLSHFGNVYPETFHLILRDWWQIQEFRLLTNFKLSTLFQDLQRFSRTGFLFLSRQALKHLNDIKNADGVFKMQIEYDDKFSQLDYSIFGENLVFDDQSFQNVSLTGKKSHDLWSIDQLRVDNVSLSADIRRKSGSWLIQFLGLRVGTSILAGLQGEYFDDSKTAEGKINLLEVDLKGLDEWPTVQKVFQNYPLKGNLRASGNFYYECNSQDCRNSHLDALLSVSLKNGAFQDLEFEDMSHISCHFVSDRGLTVRDIHTALKTNKNTNQRTDLQLEKLDYDLNQEILSLENLNFCIPTFDLSRITQVLSHQFSTVFNPIINEMIANIKTHGEVAGHLNLDYAAPHYAIKLALKDDDYCFFNKKFTLSNFLLEYDPCEIKLMAKNNQETFPFWIYYKSNHADLSHGDVIITEDSPLNLPPQPLIVQWSYEAEKGLLFNQAVGQFQGMTIALEKENKGDVAQVLTGMIKFNAKKTVNYFSQGLGTKLANWNMDSDFHLRGRWELKPTEEDLLNTHFKGQLEGKNLVCKGYKFDTLFADLQFSPDCIQLKNLRVSDPCGTLTMGTLNIDRNPRGWQFSIPQMRLQDFKIGQIPKIDLTEVDRTESLVIRELDLENFQGILGDPESFTGQGSFVFVNPPKKNTLHPLFAIPGEILARLGLDLSVLNPVIGTVYYDVKKSKVFLRRIKDVYSQGKMSKFYLPNNSYQSYIDFEGNLHIQIKMKHYNLIFKLAELLTVTVQGTLQKPTYTLQKTKS